MQRGTDRHSTRIPRFICDEQLGRLAKWLRLQGFDTVYQCPMADSLLIRLAHTEGRMLLTRDHHLAAKTIWKKILVIEATDYAKQLRELFSEIKLPKGAPFSRCLDCNERFCSISKTEVKGHVPEQVYETYEVFQSCPSCKKIFWQGSHVKASRRRLLRLKGRG